jgi:hypothetical protein
MKESMQPPFSLMSYLFPHSGNKYDRIVGLVRRGALLAGALLALCGWQPLAGSAAPIPTRLVYAPGRIVPLPASVPHEAGDMADRRIVPDLRWIAARYPIYVTDGYSGPLPSGARVGCNGCHVRHSDHYNGLAVDVVPLEGSSKCDAAWRPITRLARWAEPVQGKPRAPFRWVGYDGDAGHGCGNHLHLSWEHATAPMFQLAEWVEVFPVRLQDVAAQPTPEGPRGGTEPEAVPPPTPEGGAPPEPTASESTRANGPSGGFATAQSGGIGAGD